MRRKSEIQTAVNVQSGGVNEGLAKPWYHSDTDVLVIAPPIADRGHAKTQRYLATETPAGRLVGLCFSVSMMASGRMRRGL